MLTYRNEIDGLRAIAIIPVIFYHAGFHKLFAGGYVGVDIFFVISGYLITSVIENECDNNTFSLVNFYERRCRRILPALFLIIFISSLFAHYWMIPERLVEFGQSVISIVLLSSNFFFCWKDDGYFAKLTEFNPLVHTWSLAVEEQFYFVFPLLCCVFNRKKRKLVTILIFFTVLSFFLAQWGGNLYSIKDQQFRMFAQHRWASFYLPIGRIWELMLGVFAAFYLRTDNWIRNCNKKWKEFFGLLGLGFITVSIVAFDNRNIPPFPNCYTLLPTFGATLIILFGEKNTFVGSLLSKRPLQWIGLISYSAYLWHQPLFAFTRLRYSEIPSISCSILIISVVLILSVLSYLFIEQPFRKKNRINRKQIFISVIVTTLLTFSLALFLIRTANNQLLSIDNNEDSYLTELRQHGTIFYTWIAYNRHLGLRLFSNDTTSTKRRLVVIGDSFSQDFQNIINTGKYLTNYEIRPYYIFSGCQIYIGPEDRQQFILVQDRQRCANKEEDIKYAMPVIRQAHIIILTSAWHMWSAQRLPTTIKLLNLTTEQKLFIIGTKHFGTVQPLLYVNKSKEYRIAQYQYPSKDFVNVNTFMEKIIDPSIFVNVMKMLCTGHNNTCALFTKDGKLISYDGLHLTKYGALHLGKMIFNQKPLNQL